MPFISTTEMNALTHRNLRPTIIDQRFQSATMLGILRGKKRIKVEDGGSIVAQPILVQINDTAMSYAGADVLASSAQEEFSAYELPWKQAQVSVVVTGIDRARNQGRAQSVNFVKNKQESALLALFNLLAGFVFVDGTGNNGKDFDGFLGAINNAAGFQNYLGVDRVANSFWQAQIFDPGTPTALSANSMMTLFMATKTDEEVIDVISGTKAGYQQYWALLTAGERYVDDTIGNLGFSNIAFQGKALVEDSHNPAGQFFFWNLDHCRLVILRGHEFVFRDFQEPDNQDIQIGRWLVYGNYECRKPPSCGVYRNILNG
jgi:hypothetical protein